jgi:mRNA-degrading endonuclease toxin of MazEF toxin-antitoxin module
VSIATGFPEPVPGLVIRYAYLWPDDEIRGREEGKDRPCAIILAVRHGPGDQGTVVVAPITHSPPDDPRHAIELPTATKQRLGLDEKRSWIKTDHLNLFEWPGPDIRVIAKKGGGTHFAYGLLPQSLTLDLIANVRERIKEGRAKRVDRDSGG